ncbi:unnamed protein product [Thlaspi arvense]|uniref:Uncharacterized protein n=1 Tax=Thlaspi arvense TaxID=13288 RepID=A0AAU9RTM2_THLAR|nr:unnamed protein product [Thlaspi arvense]
MEFVHTMRAVQGSLIVSSLINIILGYGKVWGNLTRLFSPVVVVPIRLPTACKLRGDWPANVNIAVIFQQYLKNLHSRAHTILERFALLFCIGLVWAFAAILTAAGAYNDDASRARQNCRVDSSNLLRSAPWIKIPYPFQWGPPIFRASHVFGMMGLHLFHQQSAVHRSNLCCITACRCYSTSSSLFSRSIGLQGVGQLLEGIFGAVLLYHRFCVIARCYGYFIILLRMKMLLLGLTRVGSRRVVQISTAFMIFFSIFGKFGAFFASIPLPIFAALLLGFRSFNLQTRTPCEIFMCWASLFPRNIIPQYFIMHTDQSTGYGPVKTSAGWFNDIWNTMFASPPAVAIIVGALLDNTLEAKHVDDRGLPWWVPFQERKGDGRNDEFYSYPVRINELIPSRFL